MEGDSGIPSSSQYAVESFAASVEEAIQSYESAVKVHLVNVASEASTLRSFYGLALRLLRYDFDKATAATLRMRKYVSDRQPSEKDLECSLEVVNGLSNVKGYDWASCLRLMDEIKEHSWIERETFLKSKSVMRRRKKIVLSLYKRGFLGLNTLPDDKRDAFLQLPLVIGLSNGDFRSWRGHDHGGSTIHHPAHNPNIEIRSHIIPSNQSARFFVKLKGSVDEGLGGLTPKTPPSEQ